MRTALVVGAIAFAAAVLAVVGPANVSRGVYRWPAAGSAESSSASTGASGRMLFAPLLLSRYTPARLSVDVPCAEVARTASPGEQFTILATANDPSGSRGLRLVVEGEKLRFGVGDAVLATGPWSGATLADPGCMVSAGFQGNEWRLEVGGRELGRGRHAAPVVTGLFTQLPRPVDGESGLSVRVVTAAAGSSPSWRQVVLTVVAFAAGIATLVLLIGAGGRRRRLRTRADPAGTPGLQRVVRALAWVDAVVVIALGAWWFFGPVLYDDGWVLATVVNFTKSGAFSNYYDIFDGQYPLGFLNFLFHFGSSRISTSLLWMRLPVLVMGLGTWALLRVYFARLRDAAGGAARIALAAMFLLCWFAWLSTLRPEPMVALLSVVVLLAVQRFFQTAALGALAVAVFAATVAVTIHPEGVVTIAPLLVAVPAVWRWTHERGAVGVVTLVALALVAVAALLLLVMADTDLAQWRHNQEIFAGNNLNALSWRDELFRYELLLRANTFWGPVVRRASAVFAVVAVALFVTRPARRREAAFDLPVMSLMVGVLLMALTPSKWTWQFGALAGFASLAVATELCRLGLEPVGSESRNRRSLVVLGVTVVASAIAWRGGAVFGDFAVVDIDFGRGGSGFLGVDLSSPVPWLVLGVGALAVCAVVAARRRRLAVRPVVDAWLAYTGVWAVPVAVGAVAVATLGLFVSDAFAQSPGWSLPRQQYDALTGDTCGMADDIGVADPTRGTPLEPDPLPAATGIRSIPEAARGTSVDFTADGSPAPPAGVDLETRWGSRITGDDDTGVFASPWAKVGFDTSSQRSDGPGLVLYTAGKPHSAGNSLFVQFGRRDGRAIHPVGLERIDAPDSDVVWQPSALDLPPHADRVRVIAVDAASKFGGWLAFSAPRRVRFRALDSVLTRPGVTALVGPAVRFYFPCATNPTIEQGVAHAPDYIVTGEDDRGAGTWAQSPTAEMRDLYRSQTLIARTTNGTALNGLHIDQIVKRAALGDPTKFDSSL